MLLTLKFVDLQYYLFKREFRTEMYPVLNIPCRLRKKTYHRYKREEEKTEHANFVGIERTFEITIEYDRM